MLCVCCGMRVVSWYAEKRKFMWKSRFIVYVKIIFVKKNIIEYDDDVSDYVWRVSTYVYIEALFILNQ